MVRYLDMNAREKYQLLKVSALLCRFEAGVHPAAAAQLAAAHHGTALPAY